MFCVRGNKILILYVNIEFDLRKMVIYYIEKKNFIVRNVVVKRVSVLIEMMDV